MFKRKSRGPIAPEYRGLGSIQAVLLSLVALFPPAFSSAGPPSSIDMNILNFETAVPRLLPESFISATMPVRFDNWSKTADWGDRTALENLRHTVQPDLPGPSTSPGTYPLFTSHSYAAAGSYTATLTLYVHEWKMQNPNLVFADKKTYNVKVWDRLPLDSVTPSSKTVRRGGTLTLVAQTFADAPPSGTRVDFSADKADVFGTGKLGLHSDIPPMNKKTPQTTLTVLPTAPLGDVTILATAGSTISTKIRVLP
jgi:hypothetical protein